MTKTAARSRFSGLARTLLLLAGISVAVKGLGLLREVLIADVLGATRESDALYGTDQIRGLGGLVFLVVARAVGIDEVDDVLGMLRRRLPGRLGGGASGGQG